MKHFEAYYSISNNHEQGWIKDDATRGAISYVTDACIHLYDIYTSIGNQLEKAGEAEQSLSYLSMALDSAKNSWYSFN